MFTTLNREVYMWNSADTNTESNFSKVMYSLGAIIAVALFAGIRNKIMEKITTILKKQIYRILGIKQAQDAEELVDNHDLDLIEDIKEEQVDLKEENQELTDTSQLSAPDQLPNHANLLTYELAENQLEEEVKSDSDYSEEYLDLSKLTKLTLTRSGVRQRSDSSEQGRVIRATTNSYVPDYEEDLLLSQPPAPHPLTLSFDRFKQVAKEKAESDFKAKEQKKTAKINVGCCVIN